MASIIQINWLDYGPYKILDVPDKFHNQVLEFMLEYFRSYPLFKILKISQDNQTEQEFLKLVKHILLDESSIMVVNENNEIKGIALLKCMTQEWRSWIALQLLIENKIFKELYASITWCREQQSLKYPKNPAGDSLHIFCFHFCEELRKDEKFLLKFLSTIQEVAQHMHLEKVTYLCLTRENAEIMELAGFKEMIRIIYSMYVFKGKRPFDRLRDINEMYGGFYEKQVEKLKPYKEMVLRHEEELKEMSKQLREEEKKEKHK